MTVTNQNNVHVESKSRLNLGNACYCSVQNLFSSTLFSKSLKIKMHSLFSSILFSKNLKIKMYKIAVLPVILCECELGPSY